MSWFLFDLGLCNFDDVMSGNYVCNASGTKDDCGLSVWPSSFFGFYSGFRWRYSSPNYRATRIPSLGRAMRGVSLFTGLGGMDIGFARAGIISVLGNEIDPVAGLNYQQNVPENQLIIGSIQDHKIRKKITASKNIDVVFGGPPCQGFSVAGKMDPYDARSQLIWDFMGVVDKVRPRAFVMENVKALAVNKRWKAIRSNLISHATQSGYLASIVVLNSMDFGVPQKRERMFLMGFRKDNFHRHKNIDLENRILDFSREHECAAERVSDVIQRLGPAGLGLNQTCCNAKVVFAKKPVLRSSPYAGMMFNGSGRPLRPNGVSSTLPASMGGNSTPIIDEAEIFKGKPSFIESYHRHLMAGGKPRSNEAPPRLRRLTIQECLEIQTFPVDMSLKGSPNSSFRQIGNAVPCKLAEAVGFITTRILTES